MEATTGERKEGWDVLENEENSESERRKNAEKTVNVTQNGPLRNPLVFEKGELWRKRKGRKG